MHYYFIIFLLLIPGVYVFAESDSIILELESQAKELVDNEEYENALIHLDKILEIDPNNISALNNKGGVLIKIGNYSDSITYFDSILEFDDNNTQALNNKAIALYKQELYVTSLRTFYQSMLSDPTNENTFNNTKSVIDELYWIDETENAYGAITIRDKDNNLVAYSKIDAIKIQPPLGYILLEEFGTKSEIEINGEKIKVLEYESSLQVTNTSYLGIGGLFLKVGIFDAHVVEMPLNGQIVSAGDTVEYKLIIIDPTF